MGRAAIWLPNSFSLLHSLCRNKDLFGDPKSIRLATVNPLADDQRKTELQQTHRTLEDMVDGRRLGARRSAAMFGVLKD